MGQQYQYFDLSRFPKPWLGDFVDDTMKNVQGAARSRAEMDLKRQEAEQKARFENDQNANSREARAEQARRDAVHEAQSQARQQGADTKNIMALLGSGNKDAAQAMAASSQYEDVRRPGKTAGAALKHYLTGPNGEMQDYDTALKASPGMEPPPFIPGDVTPAQALGRFLGAAPKPDALQPPPPGQQPQPPEPTPDPTAAAAGLAPLPGMETMGAGAAAIQTQENDQNYHDQVDLQAEARKATTEGLGKRERWGLSFAGGPETIIDPEQAKQAAIQDSQEKRDRLLAAAAGETNPETRAAMVREAELIGAQASNATRATVGNAAAQASSQAFKKEYGDTHDMTAAEKYAIAMRPHGGPGPESVQGKRYNLAVSGEVRQKISSVMNQAEFKPIVDSYRTLNQMRELLRSDNSANHKLAAGLWAKWASGPGAVQQSEREEFMNTIGGKFGSFEKVMKNWADGKLPDSQRQIVLDALEQTLLPMNEHNMTSVMDAVHAAVANDPNPDIAAYGDYADRYVNTYTHPSVVSPSRPGARPTTPPGPGSAAAAPAGGLSQEDAAMVQRAKAAIADPGTPPRTKANAQALLQHFQLAP